ncbi:LysR substrate-binding domain-containing protein [Phaeovulum sp.]|uniref:LysR substrate-binding domain-containing protein n=1 Tax=Phaeovulum sp. TaxID=2934796 RepID=UPI0039E5A034
MQKLRRALPSLSNIYVIDAVARHLSFTEAARELGISQPAVSKSVKTVEAGIGVRLFDRKHRGLSVTPEGQIFCSECAAILARLDRVVASFAKPRGAAPVKLSFSSSFVALWLLPKLPALKSLYPQMSLSIDESISEYLDPRVTDYDFSSRLGKGEWDGFDSWLLVPERICAVATPEYLARNAERFASEGFGALTLLHTVEPKRKRTTWAEWLHGVGLPGEDLNSDMVFSDYHSAVDAALLGQGAALGWAHVTEDLLATGRLVQVGDRWLQTGDAFYIVSPSDREHSALHKAFLRWILGAAKDCQPSALAEDQGRVVN